MIDKNGCGVASTATGRFQVGHASGFLSLVTERPAAVLSSPCRAPCTNSDASRDACWLAASATESASRTSVTVSAAAFMKIYKISIEERRSGKFVGRRAAASRRGNAVHGVRRIGHPSSSQSTLCGAPISQRKQCSYKSQPCSFHAYLLGLLAKIKCSI